MGDYALAAARQVGLGGEAFDLVLAGGVFGHPSSLLPDHVTARVRREHPRVRPVRPALEPVAGAILLALDAVGLPTSATTLTQSVVSLPSRRERRGAGRVGHISRAVHDSG